MTTESTRNLIERVKLHATERPNDTAFRFKRGGQWEAHTWKQVWDRATHLAAVLEQRGVGVGDRVALFSNNRPEWFFLDFATQLLRAVTVPIYMNSTASDAAYILSHTEAALCLVDSTEKLEKLQSVRKDTPALKTLVATVTADIDDDRIVAFDAFSKEQDAPDDAKVQGWLDGIQEDDLGSIIYTSGTTGRPKGVMITLHNLMSVMKLLPELLPGLDKNAHGFSYLPLAHVAQRAGDYATIFAGAKLSICDDINLFADLVQEVQPTFFVAVPRVLEKVYQKVKTQVAAAAPHRRAIFGWAEGVAHQFCNEDLSGFISPWTQFQWTIANAIVYGKIKAKLGGNIQFIVAGGAALPKHIGEFFHGIGIPVVEAYGMTESSALICFSPPSEVRYGTVNRVLPVGEVRFSDEGELQYRGPNVMRGYYKNEEATKETIIEDGWLCTGDIGEQDADGYVRITGRKKEMIVTSGGKNLAPVPVETAVKRLPFVSQVMVVGDERPYLTALVTFSEEDAQTTLEEAGESLASGQGYHEHPTLRQKLDEHIKAVNADLPSYSTIKKYTVLPRDLSVEEKELTPTLKLKRPVIQEHFAKEIEEMYASSK